MIGESKPCSHAVLRIHLYIGLQSDLVPSVLSCIQEYTHLSEYSTQPHVASIHIIYTVCI